MRCDGNSQERVSKVVNQGAVIILHYGSPATTVNCIASFFTPGISPDIILIDNDPGCRCRVPRGTACIYLPQKKNLGFAAGVNLGLCKAIELGKKAVLLLNNDVETSLETVVRLLHHAISGPAIFGGVEMAMAGRGAHAPDVIFAGGDMAWRETAVRLWTRPLSVRTPYPTGFVRGSCMAFPLSLVRRIGFLDEAFWAYNEDVDFCLKALDAKYQLFIDPAARVWHSVSESFDPYLRNYLMARNYVRLANRHAKGHRFVRAMGLSMAASLASLAVKRRKGKFNGFLAGIRAEYMSIKTIAAMLKKKGGA